MSTVIKKTAGFIVTLLLFNTAWGQSAAFNQNASRSNHTRVRYAISPALPEQNNNTVRSNRGGLWDIEMPGDFEATVTAQALSSALQDNADGIKATERSISNVLKTKHDTAKNSISNVR